MTDQSWRAKKDPGGITRRAKTRTCDKCGAPVKIGLDADVLAFTATIDPTPLDADGELHALLQGRRTYELLWMRDHYEIETRPAHRIRAHPPVTLRHTVHAEHRCHHPMPPGRIDRATHPGQPDTDDDTPPF